MCARRIGKGMVFRSGRSSNAFVTIYEYVEAIAMVLGLGEACAACLLVGDHIGIWLGGAGFGDRKWIRAVGGRLGPGTGAKITADW